MNLQVRSIRSFIGTSLIVLMIALMAAACSDSGSKNSTPAKSAKDQQTAAQPQKSNEPAKADSSKKPANAQEMALYEGADREKLLLEGAKKEGSLTVYGSMPVEDAKALGEAFEKKYGVKVNVWRASGETVAQRVITEAQGQKYEADIIENDSVALEAIAREKLFLKVNSPHFKNLIDQAVQKNHEWVGTRLNVFVQAYHTGKVKKEDVPKKWEDFLDPKWKGMLGVEAEDLDWFAVTVNHLGEQKGIQLFKDIVAKNGISVRKGHTLLANLTASGEVPFSLTVYNFTAESLKKKGAPFDWYAIEPAVARANGVGVAQKAPHPYAALLFYDFMLSDGQEILLKRNFVPSSKKLDTPLNKMPMKFVDPAIILDQKEKWTKLYEEIFVKRGAK